MDVAKLDGLQLFEGLSMQQRELVAQHAVEVDVPEGKELVRDGALAWDFYVIEEGSAEVRRGQKTLGTLGAGDFFGEMGVMASDRRNYFFQPSMMDPRKLNSSIVLVKLNGKDIYCDPGSKFTPFGL